ncbi:MAG TPA: hypothetical protein VFO25_03265 [Candidatus Eremiobacteraceae bacterium]|nr:hypothetical protein [Candidatus Eremiobacteraceae bacterium]
MNAAIRWLADFVRGRSGPWPDSGTRLRVYIIAAMLLFGGICVLVYDFRQPLWPLYPGTIALHLIYVAATVGLFYRSRAAYMYAYLYTLLGAITTACALFMLPLEAIFRSLADDPIFELNVILICIFVGVLALLGYGVRKLEQLYKLLVSWRATLQGPTYGLVVVGGMFIIAWSVVQAVDPNFFTELMIENPSYNASAVGLLAIAVLPILAAFLWAYISLRSRAVRDAFDLP